MAKTRRRQRQHDAIVLYPHHRKPYRVRHLAPLVVAAALVFALTLELGIIIGHDQRRTTPPTPPPAAKTSAAPSAGPVVVRSGYGYSLAADSNVFTIIATADGQGQPVAQDQLKDGRPLTAVTVKAKSGAVSGRLAATRLTVKVNPDAAALTAAEKLPRNAKLSAAETAATLFPVSAGGEVTVQKVSSELDKLNGVPVQKTVYQFTGKHSGGKSYAIQWSGVNKGRAFSVELDGLAGRSTIPGEFATVLDSLTISSDQAVLGASTTAGTVFARAKGNTDTLDAKYLSDSLSPAVVQIFHTVCGVLTVEGRDVTDSDCISFSGSGFLATRTGYIATNGHVVVYTAKDALADLVTSNDNVLAAYLQGLGLSQAQIDQIKDDPAALAALISKIYDLPDSQLHFSNKGELTLVALGSDEPNLKKLANIRSAAQLEQFRKDNGTIKHADVIAYDYDAKDEFTAIADPSAGFSSSDVALLKVDVADAPAIPVETGRVVQNEPLIVMGFPGDANNLLTDNTETDVTVTDGVVSSIREAAGGRGKLYQSDADSSHGNSGGPAIDDQGKAIGLMTYRYADTNNGNAAKSYIRDIADFTDLAARNDVAIDSTSRTQQAWEHGLELYSRSHYSAALKDFYTVRELYPPHRLVDSYIESAQQAMADGKDVTDAPVVLIAAVLAAAVLGLAATVVLAVRHHALHRVYQTSVPDAAGQKTVYLAKTPPPAKK